VISLDAAVKKKKNRIGIIAIALLILVTVLAVIGYINFIQWIVVDLAIALIANLLLRRVGKQTG